MRGGPLAAALVTLAIGSTATALGLGIGPAWLAKDGWSLLALAGLVDLLVGLALLVGGTVALIARTPGWWRLVAVPVASIAVVTVVYPLAVATAATQVPPTAVGSRTPSDLGLGYDVVAVTTTDGVRLSGWYIPSRRGAAVVLRHGSGSTRADVLDQAAVLADAGYGVLMLDARGHGESGGRAMDLGWYGDVDTSAAVDYLQRRPDVDAGRIAVVGLSMGGEEALGAGAADSRVAAVVAEGVTSRSAADKDWLPEEYGLAGRVQVGLDRLTYALVDAFTAASAPTPLREAVRALAPRPVLVIAGGAVPDEVETAERLELAAPVTVQVWVAPGSGHTRALADHRAEWTSRVVGFLDGALATSEG